MISALVEFENELKIAHDDTSLNIKQAVMQLHHEQCIQKDTGKYLLKFYRSLSPRPPLYLYHDTKPLVILRAKLRFNLSLLNYSLFSRGGVNNASCPHCANVTETRDHVLLNCPMYAADRTLLSIITKQPLTLQLILDPPKQYLLPTAQFLLNINNIRPI